MPSLDLTPRTVRLLDCTADLITGRVQRGGGEQRLTSLESMLLAYLVAQPNEVLGRERLLADVWNHRAAGQTRIVDVTVRRLRVKIESRPGDPEHILTVFGHGYRFVPHQPAPQPRACRRPRWAAPRVAVRSLALADGRRGALKPR